MLVGHGEGPVVARHGERVDLRRLVGAERAGVDEGEMGDVEEVVRQQARRSPGPQRREKALQERAVVRLRDRSEGGDGWLGGEEDDAVRLGDGGGRPSDGRSGATSPLPPAPGSDAAAVPVETPPVIGALQHAGLAMAQSERAMPVGAAVDDRPHLAVRPVQGPGLTQQHHSVRLVGDVPGAGHRMPAVAQRRVRVGQNAWPRRHPGAPGYTASRTPWRTDVRCSRRRTKEWEPWTQRAQATKEHPPSARRDRLGGPLDPRLLHYARTTRRFLVLAVAIGGVTALLLIAQAWLIARIVAGAFLDHQTLGSLRGALLALLAVIAGRSVLAWSAERTAHRASASAKSELRRAAAEKVAALGPAALEGSEPGRLSTLLTTGIEALDGYFARYLPQLFLAVIVPIAVIAVVAGADWVSAVLIAVSLPLIPIFMALVGATTRDRTLARMRSLQKLAGHFLDVVAGLPTLKVFGRAKAQARAIADVTDRYRATTLATLRLTFLSSLVLELLATVSVALVAVAVGLRLLGGDMSFRDALFVLVLAPEAYLPLRALGANYHASADGMQAAQDVFTLLEQPAGRPTGGATKAADTSVRVRGLEVTYPGRRVPALDGAELVVAPGETVAVTGPSGCGKSTLLCVVLGLARPRRRIGVPRRRRPRRPRPRRLAGPHRLGAPTAAPLRPVGGRERPARPPRRDGRRGGGSPRGRRADRGRAPAAAGRGHPAGRRRGRALGRRAPARLPRPGLRAGRTPAPPGRADRQASTARRKRTCWPPCAAS